MGMFFLALTTSVIFTACSSDDDEPSSPTESAMKVSSITSTETGYDGVSKALFTYDSKGRLTTARNSESGYSYNSTDLYTYVWNDDNSISIKRQRDSEEALAYATVTVSNSRITSYVGREETLIFSYDAKGYLSSLKSTESSYDITWMDGNLVYLKEKRDYSGSSYTYDLVYNTAVVNPGLFGITSSNTFDFETGLAILLTAHPKFLGTLSKNAIKQIKSVYHSEEYGEDATIYNYEYDKNEFPTRIVERYGQTSEYNYEITWN